VRRLSFAASIALVALGCEPSFQDAHVLDELRVLAVRAEPPEVAVGDAVHLEALVVSPSGAPVTVHIWQCAARGGMGQGCETFDDSLDLGEGTSADLVIGEDWQARLDRAGGLPVFQVLTIVAEQDGVVARAIKRVVVSDWDSKNANPVLEALLLDDEEEEGGPYVVAAGGSARMHPIVGEGSVEDYQKVRIDGTLSPATETLFLSNYYSCGKVSTLRSGGPDDLDATWRAPSTPGTCTVHSILRDDRGGVSFRAREIVVE
jgi:hypothetical protein